MAPEAVPAGPAWALLLATHALPLFCVTLSLLLTGAVVCWRYAGRVRPPAWTPALASVAACTVVFAVLSSALGDGGAIGRIDQTVSDRIGATAGTGTVRAFSLVTHFGDSATLTLLCIAGAVTLALHRLPILAAGWVAAIGGNALLNISLKALFARARPEHAQSLLNATGYSFPSGHTSGSCVAYGMLAYVLLRALPPRWRGSPVQLAGVLLATAIAFATGCSRVFIQAHFPSDVLAGFASGLTWLTLCISATEWLLARRKLRHRGSLSNI